MITKAKTGKRIYKIVTALLEEQWDLSGSVQLAMTGSTGQFNYMIKEYLQAMVKTS